MHGHIASKVFHVSNQRLSTYLRVDNEIMSMPVTLNGVVYYKLFYLVTLLVNLRVLDSSREWPCPFIENNFWDRC